jgi:Domain of unknown function (DUF1736)/Tetratricopeptide repeat
MYVRWWYTDGTYLKMSVQDNPVSFEEDFLGRFLSYAVIHGEYARLLVYPYWLSYDYSLNTIPLVCEWADLRLLAPLTGYLGFFGMASFACHKKQGETLIALAVFLLVFLPMSNIFFAVGTVVGERLMYLPSVAFIWVVIRLVQGDEPDTERSTLTGLIFPRIIWLTVIASWTRRTMSRVDDWKTADNLVNIDGAINLKSAKTQFNLGVHYFTKKNYDLAFEALQRSVKSDPEQRDAIAFWRMGQIEILRGNLENASELLVAATTKHGARLLVKEEEVFHDAGLALYHSGKLDKAKYYLTAALTLNRKFPKALNNYACYETNSNGSLETAMNLIYEAAHLKPRNVIYWGNAWLIGEKLGIRDVVEKSSRMALAIQPDYVRNQYCTWEFKPASGGPGVTDDDEAEEQERLRLKAGEGIAAP